MLSNVNYRLKARHAMCEQKARQVRAVRRDKERIKRLQAAGIKYKYTPLTIGTDVAPSQQDN